MLKSITSAVSSAVASARGSPAPVPLGDDHCDAGRLKQYQAIANALSDAHIPVSEGDCVACDAPCADGQNGSSGNVPEVGNAWDGKTYDQYVLEKYGDLGPLPPTVDTDWESDLAGSGGPPVGRVVVISTGKSNWLRDHTDEKDSLSHQLSNVLAKQPAGEGKKNKDGNPLIPSTYIKPSAFPTPSTPLTKPVTQLPSLYSSSLVSQSDDPQDQMALVFPDWKVCMEVENSEAGAQSLWDNVLAGTIDRAGRPLQNGGEGVERRRSYVMPYRAIVLLCSHKTRDKRCYIASNALRPAFIDCFEKNNIAVDEVGKSLANLCERPALETLEGDNDEREEEVGRQIEAIEGVHGGPCGEVGLFNINHLGGHRYAGVLLILLPSGAYLSYGRVSPHEVPRIVEETIMQGKVVPGLIRSGTGLARPGACGKESGFLSW